MDCAGQRGEGSQIWESNENLKKNELPLTLISLGKSLSGLYTAHIACSIFYISPCWKGHLWQWPREKVLRGEEQAKFHSVNGSSFGLSGSHV